MPWLTSARGRDRTVALPIASCLDRTAQMHATKAVDAAVSGAVPTVASGRWLGRQVQEPSSMAPTGQSAVSSVAGGLDQASGVTIHSSTDGIEAQDADVRRQRDAHQKTQGTSRARALATLGRALVLDEANVGIMPTAVRR